MIIEEEVIKRRDNVNELLAELGGEGESVKYCDMIVNSIESLSEFWETPGGTLIIKDMEDVVEDTEHYEQNLMASVNQLSKERVSYRLNSFLEEILKK